MGKQSNPDDVFINCPFDTEYQPLFNALFFVVVDCGFRVRCALEVDDGSQVRIEKILRIIGESRYGIHDISRTELDVVTKLPRFNMPLELGMFLGAKRFGGSAQKRKACLIVDKERYRFQKFLSDIAGQDPKAHENDPERLICVVRNWLRSVSERSTLPGGKSIYKRYANFVLELPVLCAEIDIDPDDLTFADYANMVSVWLKENT